MKNRAVIETAVDELEEVPDREWRLLAVEFEDNRALGRHDFDVGMRGNFVRGQNQGAGKPKIRAIRVFFIQPQAK